MGWVHWNIKVILMKFRHWLSRQIVIGSIGNDQNDNISSPYFLASKLKRLRPQHPLRARRMYCTQWYIPVRTCRRTHYSVCSMNETVKVDQFTRLAARSKGRTLHNILCCTSVASVQLVSSPATERWRGVRKWRSKEPITSTWN